MNGRIEDVLKKRNIAYRTGVVTATLCTFRIGGPAAFLVEPQCIGELVDAVLTCHREKIPYAVIGKGSNILFGDEPFSTVLIRTTALDAVRSLGNGRLYGLCGTSLTALSFRAAREGLGGLSFVCGIPGTLGGALYMNAGAHGGEMSDVVESARILDLNDQKIKTLFNEKLSFSYRNSLFQSKNMVALGATLQLAPNCDSHELFERMRAAGDLRREKQPLDLPNAGSVFRRPSPDVAVARIIDELGLKGKRVGGAKVSEKHAGFIVNTGGATARDVLALIEEIQNTVERERGFRPSPELRFIPDGK